MEITFFLKQDETSKRWHAHSVLSPINGYGDTKEEAIDNHIQRFNEANKNSKLEQIARNAPGVTLQKCSFVLADEKAPM